MIPHLRWNTFTHNFVFVGEIVLRLPLASPGHVADQRQTLLTRSNPPDNRWREQTQRGMTEGKGGGDEGAV